MIPPKLRCSPWGLSALLMSCVTVIRVIVTGVPSHFWDSFFYLVRSGHFLGLWGGVSTAPGPTSGTVPAAPAQPWLPHPSGEGGARVRRAGQEREPILHAPQPPGLKARVDLGDGRGQLAWVPQVEAKDLGQGQERGQFLQLFSTLLWGWGWGQALILKGLGGLTLQKGSGAGWRRLCWPDCGRGMVRMISGWTQGAKVWARSLANLTWNSPIPPSALPPPQPVRTGRGRGL